MTDRELFDFVVNHLVSQGCPSKQAFGKNCAYRGPQGRKCAVGCLINDDNYRPSLEGKVALHRHVVEALTNSVGSFDFALCSALQTAHDQHNSEPMSEWRARLVESLGAIAREFGFSDWSFPGWKTS